MVSLPVPLPHMDGELEWTCSDPDQVSVERISQRLDVYLSQGFSDPFLLWMRPPWESRPLNPKTSNATLILQRTVSRRVISVQRWLETGFGALLLHTAHAPLLYPSDQGLAVTTFPVSPMIGCFPSERVGIF